MMRLLLVAIGLASVAVAPAVAAQGLYERVRADVLEETGETLDPSVASFVADVLSGAEPVNSPAVLQPISVTPENVESAVAGRLYELCGDEPQSECLVRQRLVEFAEREQRVRTIASRLQAIVAGEEAVVFAQGTPYLAPSLQIASDIWIRSDEGEPRIHVADIPESDDLEDLFEELADELSNLDQEQRAAVSLRYRFGVRLVRGEREVLEPVFDEAEEDTERWLLAKRWDGSGVLPGGGEVPNIEDPLARLWEYVRFEIDVPANEVRFVRFPEEYQSLLPDGFRAWVVIDGYPSFPGKWSDGGLLLEFPLITVLPALVTGNEDAEPILGGAYPPEPSEEAVADPDDSLVIEDSPAVYETPLCSDPFQARGFLCRPVPDGAACEDEPILEDNEIRLFTCEEQEERATMAGPDICRDIVWRTIPGEQDTPEFDPDRQCILDISCVGIIGGSEMQGGFTYVKESDGTVRIEIQNDSTALSRTTPVHLMLHELTHARQFCNYPPNTGQYDHIDELTDEGLFNAGAEACCTFEGEGYGVQCEEMERDGLFINRATGERYVYDPSTGAIRLGGEGIPMNARTCTEAFRSYACATDRQGEPAIDGPGSCPRLYEYDIAFFEALRDLSVTNLPADQPRTCEELLENPDPRVAGLIAQIESEAGIALPNSDTDYPESILGNLCYAGGLLEEVTEHHLLPDGVLPQVTAGIDQPWLAGRTEVGAEEYRQDESSVVLPEYRPAQFVADADAQLCQSSGLPVSLPPLTCLFDADLRLRSPLSLAVSNTVSITRQFAQQGDAVSGLRYTVPAEASRLSTMLWTEGASPLVRSLASDVSRISDLLSSIAAVQFPVEMCPVDGSTLP